MILKYFCNIKIWSIFLSIYYFIKVKVKPLSCVQLFATRGPPNSSVYGFLQARILEWVAISFSILKNYFIIIILLKPVVKYKNKSIKYCWWNFTIRTTWVSAKPLYVCLAVAQQAPLSMGFSRLEYWSGLPYPSPGNLPNPGTEPASLGSPALAGRFFTTSNT